MTTANTTDRGFTIVRHLDAPRKLVFQAWAAPEHLAWFAGAAPNAHPTTVDLRVGGTWRFHMIENGQRSYATGGIYGGRPTRKLVFTSGAVDGWPPIDPSHPDDGPIVTITLNDTGGATDMVFHLGFADHLGQERIREWFATGMVEGWTETPDRRLAGDQVAQETAPLEVEGVPPSVHQPDWMVAADRG